MRVRQLFGCGAVALVLLACGGDDDSSTPSSSSSTGPTVTAGDVAAVELVPGDCMSGLVIGAAERIRVESVRVVSCEDSHELELFASFLLSPGDFESTPVGEYPGQERVVAAADAGCGAALERLGVDYSTYGLIALWPTKSSWLTGDREVGCAAFSTDGSPFERRTLLASS